MSYDTNGARQGPTTKNKNKNNKDVLLLALAIYVDKHRPNNPKDNAARWSHRQQPLKLKK